MIFLFSIKKMLNNKKVLISMYIIPLLFSFFVIQMNFNFSEFKISVIDNDKTRLTAILIKNLKSMYRVDNENKEKSINEIELGDRNNLLVIDKGYTKNIIENKKPNFKIYSHKEDGSYDSVYTYVNYFTEGSIKAALMANKSSEDFYKKLSTILENNYKYIQTQGDVKLTTRSLLNFLVMFMLINSFNFCPRILYEEKNKDRTLSAPVTVKSYMFQKIMALLLIEIIQVMLVFGQLLVLYGSVMRKYFFMLFILFLVFSFTAVSLSMFVNYFKAMRKALNIIVVIPLCMLGGCFWSPIITPTSIRYISQFIPTTWVTDGIWQALNNNLTLFGKDIIILAMFGIVFFLLGVFTKNAVTN